MASKKFLENTNTMEYTEDQIEQMKEKLCQQEAEQVILEDSIYDILMDGCTGWNLMTNEEIIECYKTYIEEK